MNKQKILIVDDDENIAELISLYLTKECFDTKMVYNGEDALRAFDTYQPNLILLDLMIPADEQHFTVNVDIHVSKQFFGWVFSLGEGIKIIGPGEVEEQMKEEARRLLEQYENKGDARDFNEYYELRQVCPDDAEEATGIEAICFPPSEACTLPIMKERIQYAARSFLVAMDRETGKMVGFINALCTDEESLRDELFTDISLHNPNGKNVMICSVAVLPQYQGRGIAREMVRELLLEQRKLGKKCAILTCVPGKVKMYKKFGFMDRGESQSHIDCIEILP